MHISKPLSYVLQVNIYPVFHLSSVAACLRRSAILCFQLSGM